MFRHENYDLQRVYLAERQTQISAHLFELGVVSRLVETQRPDALRAPIAGLHQLERTFAPSIRDRRLRHATETQLSLVSIASAGDRSHSMTYLRIGEIDETGTLFPLPGIDKQDADAVYTSAQELVNDKTAGILPNLSSDLLGIDDPTRALVLSPEDL